MLEGLLVVLLLFLDKVTVVCPPLVNFLALSVLGRPLSELIQRGFLPLQTVISPPSAAVLTTLGETSHSLVILHRVWLSLILGLITLAKLFSILLGTTSCSNRYIIFIKFSVLSRDNPVILLFD